MDLAILYIGRVHIRNSGMKELRGMDTLSVRQLCQKNKKKKKKNKKKNRQAVTVVSLVKWRKVDQVPPVNVQANLPRPVDTIQRAHNLTTTSIQRWFSVDGRIHTTYFIRINLMQI